MLCATNLMLMNEVSSTQLITINVLLVYLSELQRSVVIRVLVYGVCK